MKCSKSYKISPRDKMMFPTLLPYRTAFLFNRKSYFSALKVTSGDFFFFLYSAREATQISNISLCPVFRFSSLFFKNRQNSSKLNVNHGANYLISYSNQIQAEKMYAKKNNRNQKMVYQKQRFSLDFVINVKDASNSFELYKKMQKITLNFA